MCWRACLSFRRISTGWKNGNVHSFYEWLGTEKRQSHRCACAMAEAPVLVETDWLGRTSAEQDL